MLIKFGLTLPKIIFGIHFISYTVKTNGVINFCIYNDMNKIKKINILFVYHNYHCTDVDPPFLDWIYNQENSKHIGITEKVRLDYQQRCLFLWELYAKNSNYKKFLYL